MEVLRVFTRRDKPDSSLQLSCYGKLPIYKDFIILESGKGATEAFKVWMDSGFGTTWENPDNGPTSVTRPHRILFAPAQHKDVAVAAIWNSHDADGLRKFPFALFVSLPKKTVNKLGTEIITGLGPVWRELESCYLALDSIPDITGFYDNFRNSRVNPPARHVAADPPDTVSRWESTTVHEIATALFQDKCQDRWADLLSRVEAAVSYGRKTAGKTASIALRLPLAASVDGPLQIEMWLRFLRHNLDCKMDVPTICFPQSVDEEATAFSVLWRDPRREDVCLLGDHASEYEHIEDLTNSGALTNEDNFSDPEIATLTARLFEENCNISDFAELTLPHDGQ